MLNSSESEAFTPADMIGYKVETAQLREPSKLMSVPEDVEIELDPNSPKSVAAQKSSGRRRGVASESTSSAALADFVKPVFHKDEASNIRIKEVLKTNAKLQVLFGHLHDQAISDVVNAFQEDTRRHGEEVIKQDAEGDCLYIIKNGSADVYVARKGVHPTGDRGAKVVTLQGGALFGELALMYSAPRAATVIIASPNCEMWRLDREHFKGLLAQGSQKQLAQYEGWLQKVDLLKELNAYELTRLAEVMDSETFDVNEDIIKQGEVGDKFFILEEGSCAAYINGDHGEKKVDTYLKQGDYFGEIALLRDEVRKATVKSEGPTGATVACISKDDFTAVLGPISEILKRNIDKYPSYQTVK